MTRPRRFLPPIAGGAQTTGWEALDKWVGGSGSSSPAAADAAPSGQKTGWEALDKWVGDGAASAPASGAGNGSSASAEPVAVPGGSEEASSGGGLMGFLKRLFGGK